MFEVDLIGTIDIVTNQPQQQLLQNSLNGSLVQMGESNRKEPPPPHKLKTL